MGAVAGLSLIAVLQNIDVIVVKHVAEESAAGAYAAAAVVAKGIIWLAVGLGLYLLPEAARRTRMGIDARPVLVRTLALTAFTAVPAILLYTVAAEPLLAAVFGEEYGQAAGALPWLALAMSLLAVRVPVRAVPAGAGARELPVGARGGGLLEPLLLQASGTQLTTIALALLGLQVGAGERRARARVPQRRAPRASGAAPA